MESSTVSQHANDKTINISTDDFSISVSIYDFTRLIHFYRSKPEPWLNYYLGSCGLSLQRWKNIPSCVGIHQNSCRPLIFTLYVYGEIVCQLLLKADEAESITTICSKHAGKFKAVSHMLIFMVAYCSFYCYQDRWNYLQLYFRLFLF